MVAQEEQNAQPEVEAADVETQQVPPAEPAIVKEKKDEQPQPEALEEEKEEQPQLETESDAESDDSSSSLSSDSSSDSDSDSDSESYSDDEPEITKAYLDSLLAKAKENALKKQQMQEPEEEILTLEADPYVVDLSLLRQVSNLCTESHYHH